MIAAKVLKDRTNETYLSAFLAQQSSDLLAPDEDFSWPRENTKSEEKQEVTFAFLVFFCG